MTWTQNKLFHPQNPRPMGSRASITYQTMLAYLREHGPKTKKQICQYLDMASTRVGEMLQYGRRYGQVRVTGNRKHGNERLYGGTNDQQ